MKNYYNSNSIFEASTKDGFTSALTSLLEKRKPWFTLLALMIVLFSNAQTTLISPTGAGGFENGTTFAANGWSVSNSANNPWFVGSVVTGSAPIAGNSAYISNDGGVTNAYTAASNATNYFWRDVTVPSGQSVITLSMNYRLQGEASWDIFQIYTAPTSVTPVGVEAHPGSGPATIPPGITGATVVGAGTLSTGVQTLTLSLPATLAGTTFRLIFSWKNEAGGTQPPAAIDNISLTSAVPVNTNAVLGGLWSSPATWAGGVVPGAGNDVTIPAGVTVTVDQLTNYRNVTVNGTLQWNSTTNAMTVTGDLTINGGGRFLPYTTAGLGLTVNVGGTFQNNGYTNLALSTLNFNGSGSNLTGTGVFEGDGGNGIIRSLIFSNLGSNTVSTSQNLILTAGLAHTAGSLNTGGKLTLNNTTQIYGQTINTGVASVAVTNMGSLYTVAPVVFGTAVTQYASGLAAVLGTRYVSGNNVYLCTAAGTFNATAPTGTNLQAIDTTSGPGLLYIGTVGNLGANIPFNNTLSFTAFYSHGDNVYQALTGTANITSAANMPIHTSGVTNGFLYIGSVAKATVNFDVTTGTVRNLTLTQNGTGFTTAPAVVFSAGNAIDLGTGAAATAVVFQSIAGPANSVIQKSGNATISGGLTINNTQGAASFSGVGGVFTSNGGLNYTAVPTVGFSGPTALNLVTNGGSGYTVAPTITLTGGTLVSGTALTSANFTITVANGSIVSVYLTGTATYSVPPTLSVSGNATIAFPAGCWATATATIGSNRQVSNFTVTNAGFGYLTAPTVGILGTAGTFTTVATAPTARIAVYNLSLGWFAPSVASALNNEGAEIPSNRKINNLTINSSAGATFTAPLSLLASAPLSLTLGNLNFGSNTLSFDSPFYAGTGGSATSFVNGSIQLRAIGGSVTRTFPFDAPVVVATGTGSLATGSTVTSLTATRVATPTGTVSPTGSVTGTRATRLVTNTGGVYGTAPIVTLNYNPTDALVSDNSSLTIAQGTTNSGPWTVRSVSTGTGTLTGSGSRATGTTAPTLIVPTGDDYYAWTSTLVAFQSAQSGDWNTPATWVGGVVPPTSCENVFINPTHNVTVSTAACVSKNLTISANATLTVASGDVKVGCTLNNNTLTNNGTLTVTGGILTINGNLLHNSGSTFNQSGGDINVDGNDAGIAANSVASSVSIVQLNSQNINLTGGTLTIVDPHANSVASNTITYTNSVAHVNVASTHTLKLGNGISTDAGGSITNGFRINTFASSRRILFGNLVLDALAGTNRIVTTTYDFGLSGDLTILPNSEALFSGLYTAGNINNNGTLTSTTLLGLASFADGLVSASTMSQTISGSGVFRNLAVTPTANLTSLTVNNSNTGGVTLNLPISVSGTLTMTSGVITTTNTNLLTLGTAAAAGTLTGTPSATNMIKGPFARTIAASNANTNYVLFPVGKSAYAPVSLAPTTTAVTVMKAEAFDTNTGTANASIINMSTTRRWEAPIVSGTFTNLNVRLGDAGILAISIPIQAPTAAGEYTNAFGSVATAIAGVTTQSNTAITSSNYTGFLSFATSNACAGTPTPGLTTTTANSLCFGQTVTLGLTNYTVGSGVTYQWQSSTDGITYTDITAAIGETLTVTPTASTFYRCNVTCATGPASAISTPIQVTFANSVVSTTPGSVCGLGAVTLNATPSTAATINWFAAATGGVALASGNSFTSPVISNTTSFYASAATPNNAPVTLGVGLTNSTSVGGTFLPGGFGGAKTQYIIKASELTAIGLSAGPITRLGFEPTSAGQTYQGFVVEVGATTQMIAGTTFVSGLTQVYRGTLTDDGFLPVANTLNTLTFGTGTGSSSSFNWDGASNIVVSISWSRVPATTGATVSGMKVDNVGFNATASRQTDNSTPAAMQAETSVNTFITATNRPRFTINGSVLCYSPRVEVVATVTPPPALTLSASTATICSGSTSDAITITTGAADYVSYTWSPATAVSGNAATGWVFNPTETTNYTLTASQAPQNIVANGDFGNGLTGWTSFVQNPLAASFAAANNEANITGISTITGPGGQQGFVQLNQIFTPAQIASLEVGSSYKITFSARSTVNNRSLKVNFGENGGAFVALHSQVYSLSTTNANYETTVFIVGQTFGAMKLAFEMGLMNEDVFIDNVTLKKVVPIICNTTATVNVTVNTIPSPMTITPSPALVCVDAIQSLAVTGGTLNNISILNENFNAATNAWTTTNLSTGGTPANAAWTLRPNGYATSGPWNSNDASQFYLSNSDSAGSGSITNVSLVSPSFNTQNFTQASISFWHYYQHITNGAAKVQYSIDNGITWVDIVSYVSNVGLKTAFVNANLTLPAPALNKANVKLKFQYDAAWGWFWAIDNVSISGTQQTTISWSPVTNLYTDVAATNAYVANTNASIVYFKAPTAAAAATYTATGTTGLGCIRTATVNVTVNPLPTVVTVAPAPVCSPTTVNLTTAAVTTGSDTGLVFTYFTNPTATTALATPSAVTTSGTYYIKGTNANGCSSIASVAVVVNPLPTVVTVAPPAVCTGTTVDLTASSVTTGSGAGLTFTYFTDAAATIALTSPSAVTTSGTYYINGTNANGCSTVASVVVTINITPAPTGAASQAFCGSANLSQLVATGTSIRWYTAATAGNEYPNALLSVIGLVNGTTYYASQTLNGCESPIRLAITAVINPVPSAPNASAQTFCTAPLVANLVPTGAAFTWYDASTGGAVVSTTAPLATGTYYVSQTINGCESTRTAVAVTITVTAAPTASSQTFCNSATVANLVATGTNLQWYSNSTGGAALGTTTALSSGTYYVSQTASGCESTRTAVAVTVNVTPAPTATSPQSLNDPATIANIVITGAGTVTWYASNANALSNTSPLPSTTALVNNTTYYATQTIGGCTSTPIAVLINVVLRNNSFDMNSLQYYPNPVTDVLNISYSNTITTIEVYNLIGQIVRVAQPNAVSTQLDMSNLPTATYLVKVTSEGKTATLKVVKK